MFLTSRRKLFLTILYVFPLTLESTDNLKKYIRKSILTIPFNNLNVSITPPPLPFVLLNMAILRETIHSYSLSPTLINHFCSAFLYSFQNFNILLMIRKSSLYAILQSRTYQGFIKPHNNSSILPVNISSYLKHNSLFLLSLNTVQNIFHSY